MKSEWRISEEYIGIGNERHASYGVYRLKDKDDDDLAYNREELGRWFDDRALAEDVARIMNEEEQTC